jgi:pimeloyl-ACP methyl ester carboxylesterase
MPEVSYHRAAVDGCNAFYREAGVQKTPAILLLHGLPTASHMFRDLIPRLTDQFHLIAPDLPGFGQSSVLDGLQTRSAECASGVFGR